MANEKKAKVLIASGGVYPVDESGKTLTPSVGEQVELNESQAKRLVARKKAKFVTAKKQS